MKKSASNLIRPLNLIFCCKNTTPFDFALTLRMTRRERPPPLLNHVSQIDYDIVKIDDEIDENNSKKE